MSDKLFQSWEQAVEWLIMQPDQQDFVRACYYDRPVKVAAERYWLSHEWQAIRELLPSTHGKVLDIGAGHGITSYALARDGWDVVALEPDSSDVVGAEAIRQLALTAGLSIEVIQNVGERIPSELEQFDLVFARQTLHHASDLQLFCSEVSRVLKPAGRFVTIRDHVISTQADLQVFLANHPLHRLYGGENAFLLCEYLDAFRDAGLKLLHKIRPLGSVINYAPLDAKELREGVLTRVRTLSGGEFMFRLLSSSTSLYRLFMKLASMLDSRPGRLYSFVCEKRQ